MNWGIVGWIALNLITISAEYRTIRNVGAWKRRNRLALDEIAPLEHESALALMLARNATRASAEIRTHRAILVLGAVLVLVAVGIGINDWRAPVPFYVLGGTTLHTLVWIVSAEVERRDRRTLDQIARVAAKERRERTRR